MIECSLFHSFAVFFENGRAKVRSEGIGERKGCERGQESMR